MLARRFPLTVVVFALVASACGPFSRAQPVVTHSIVAPTPSTAPAAATPTPVAASPEPSLTHLRTHPPSPSVVDTPTVAPTSPAEPSTKPSPAAPSPTPSPPAPSPAAPDISAYGGLGTWIDIYDNSDVFGPQAFGDPSRSVAVMRQNGVRTVFLEAGSYRHPPVEFPAATAAFIRAAHAAGIKVIAWYLPLFRNVRHDFAEVMRVIGFHAGDGQGYDGFAMDIEAAIVPPAERIANFLRLSALVRRAVGPSYALGAIIPSPRGLIRVPTYWPGFPYAQLPKYFDVILPMSYFTFHEHGPAAVARYVADNVGIIRESTGDPAIPIHVIGGIADDMTPDESVAFARAAEAAHVFGASLYEFDRTSDFQWRILSPLR